MSRSIPSRLKKETSKPLREEEGMAVASSDRARPALKFIDDRGLNDQTVENSMKKLHQLIINLVASFTKIVIIDGDSWPSTIDIAIWFEDLDALFHQAMGLQEKERLDHAFRRLKVDKRDASMYLRMLIGAEVSEKVLTESFPNIPMLDRKWAKQAFRTLAEDKGPEDEDKIVQLALLAFVDTEETRIQSDKAADKFTSALLETVNPMLLSYKSNVVDPEASKSRKILLREHAGSVVKDIYNVALKLRMNMNLKSCNYTFFWPPSDDAFDDRTMDVEIHQQRAESSGVPRRKGVRTVATLIPGVRRHEPSKEDGGPQHEGFDRKGQVIVRALVYLGGTHT